MDQMASYKNRSAGAVFMALALITTTFAGIGFANPSTGSGNSNMDTSLYWDAPMLYLTIEFDPGNNSSYYPNIIAQYDFVEEDEDDGSQSSFLNGTITLNEYDEPSEPYNSYIGYVFLNESDIPAEKVYYDVSADIYGVNGTVSTFLMSGMSHACIEYDAQGYPDDCASQQFYDAEEDFETIDDNIDGYVNWTEYITWYNDYSTMVDDEQDELNSTEENNTIAILSSYDLGFDDGYVTETANDNMLQINEFYEFWLDNFDYNDEEPDFSHFFGMIDADGNDNVSADEYLDFMEEDQGEPLDDSETTLLTNIILDQDTDGNGELNLTEFGAFLDALEFALYDDYQIVMFGSDTDYNGTVSLTELSEGFLSGNDEMANNTTMSTFFSNLFNYSDIDSDQELNSSEFEEFYIELDKQTGTECYEVLAGDEAEEDGILEYLDSSDSNSNGPDSHDDHDYYNHTEYLEGDVFEHNGTFCVDNQMDSQGMLWLFDSDGDGTLSLSEFFSFQVDNNTTSDHLQMLEFMFEGYDSDSSDGLNADELAAYIHDRDEGIDFDLTDEQMLGMFDTNSDGNLSLEEVLDYLTVPANATDDELQMLGFIFDNHDYDNTDSLDVLEFTDFRFYMEDENRTFVPTDEQVLAMVDTNDDGVLNLTEVLNAMHLSGNETAEELQMLGFFFDNHDYDNTDSLNVNEYADFLGYLNGNNTFVPNDEQILAMVDTDGDGNLSLTEVLDAMHLSGNETAEEIRTLGWIFEHYDDDQSMGLDSKEYRGFLDFIGSGLEYEPSAMQIMELIDADNDGSVSVAEIIDFLNTFEVQSDDELLTPIEEEYIATMFVVFDSDGNNLLDAEEFPMFFNAMNSDDNDHGDDHNQDNDDDHGSSASSVDVWFEQWNDETMHLVIVELMVIHDTQEIQELIMIADAYYGNNDNVMDQSEMDTLMAYLALNINTDDIAKGLTLDGNDGKAVDFWVEIDGLLEGDDVVFIRVGQVIEFPVEGTYETSSAHVFMVDNSDHEEDDGHEGHGHDDVCENNVRVHNSQSWVISNVISTGTEMVFSYEETNDMWYGEHDDCDASGTVTFTLEKNEDSAMPVEEDDDWTWEDEEMNLIPICDWFYTVTFANGSMMSDQAIGEDAITGSRTVELLDDASYEIGIFCWDPEGGIISIELTSALGNSSNSSSEVAWVWMQLEVPAGVGGEFPIGISWTDGYHAESGVLTIIATGDGSAGDLSNIKVTESESEGLPGFTAALGIIALLGAAMLSGRRDD